MNARYDAVVIGAGISGLSAAYRLHRHDKSVLVLESSDRVGGVMRSKELPGVGFVDLGPQTVRTKDPDLLAEFEELGIEKDRMVAGAAGSNRYILLKGRLVPIPMGPGAFATSPILPGGAKLRLLMEPFVSPRRGQDESVAEFFEHRLGHFALERMVDPFVSGVYAGDPAQLSMQAVFPSMKEGVDRHGSLLRWGLASAKAAKKDREATGAPKPPKAQLFSFREGLGQWPRALAAAVGHDRVKTSVKVTAVRRDGDTWVVDGTGPEGAWAVSAGAVILAIPAQGAAELLGVAHPNAVRPLQDIPYAPVSTVHLTYEREDVPHALDGFGYLCPSGEGRPVLGNLWISSLFPGRIQEGLVQTTTFVGGARDPDRALRPKENLVALVHAEHQAILGVQGEPIASFVATHRFAIPQYEFGHVQRAGAATSLEASSPGLFLVGAYRGGVSVGDCWAAGRASADRALQCLTGATVGIRSTAG